MGKVDSLVQQVQEDKQDRLVKQAIQDKLHRDLETRSPVGRAETQALLAMRVQVVLQAEAEEAELEDRAGPGNLLAQEQAGLEELVEALGNQDLQPQNYQFQAHLVVLLWAAEAAEAQELLMMGKRHLEQYFNVDLVLVVEVKQVGLEFLQDFMSQAKTHQRVKRVGTVLFHSVLKHN